MWPFDDIGAALGSAIKGMISSAFDASMKAIWDASLAVLRGAFGLADQFSVFTVDTRTGPISILWPMMLWISGVLALGLFFWQLTLTNLRGGRGFMRLVSGPVQYGIALAVTVGLVAGFLAAVDGLTNGILQYGLQSKNFSDALNHTSFGDGVVDGVKAVVLGVCAFVGVIPAAIGYLLEMLFREAATYVLVATIPIVVAGLLANVTANWFWRACRWLLACITMKPVLAMTLVLGVAIAGGARGLSGLLAGVGVLIISLLAPFVLFRLFAFVDPNSDAGAALRDALSDVGVDSYGANNPAMFAAGAAGGSGGGGAMEDANTGRFDETVANQANESVDDTDVGHSSTALQAAAPPPAHHGRAASSGRDLGPSDHDEGGPGDEGDDPPPPKPPDGGSGGAAAGEAGEAAVIA
ncbi:hypothetical protein FNH05_01620 [Amycolatopsis rhizosphaerae]|uniref:Type IV secretion system protein n=1 Tax=Amycolatopsis rhizosphaerae TaxID=2053003 RepID=A0A558DLS8_9PSEU|nr:hypothetical protein [Amycolatopsis rhizosphaerae]TVT61959.1 hypothetical protein FNH05_01620 [Amycolatopsis rhizosphaerae]